MDENRHRHTVWIDDDVWDQVESHYQKDNCAKRNGPDSRWVDLLAARTGWDVRNQGQNGRTIPGGPVPFPADTDLLTVMLGTNDLLQGRGPETAAERMERFLSALDLSGGGSC